MMWHFTRVIFPCYILYWNNFLMLFSDLKTPQKTNKTDRIRRFYNHFIYWEIYMRHS